MLDRAADRHNSHQIELVFKELLLLLRQAGLTTEGLFLNADSGFDSQALRQICWQENIQANIAINPAVPMSHPPRRLL